MTNILRFYTPFQSDMMRKYKKTDFKPFFSINSKNVNDVYASFGVLFRGKFITMSKNIFNPIAL